MTLTADDAGGGLHVRALRDADRRDDDGRLRQPGQRGALPRLRRINEGFTVDEAVELQGRKGSATTLAEQGAGPGESKTVEITDPIEPGNYAMLCPIGSPEGFHYELGQLEEFTIE